MPPNRKYPLNDQVQRQIAKFVATNYSVPFTDAWDITPKEIEEWGKVRRREKGDTMHASVRVSRECDSRDASFVKVLPCSSDISTV